VNSTEAESDQELAGLSTLSAICSECRCYHEKESSSPGTDVTHGRSTQSDSPAVTDLETTPAESPSPESSEHVSFDPFTSSLNAALVGELDVMSDQRREQSETAVSVSAGRRELSRHGVLQCEHIVVLQRHPIIESLQRKTMLMINTPLYHLPHYFNGHFRAKPRLANSVLILFPPHVLNQLCRGSQKNESNDHNPQKNTH